MTKRPAINEALRLLRIYCRLSQAELAALLHVSQSMVSDIEGGRKNVSFETLERYSKSLNIRMSQLLFFAEEIDGQPIERRGQLIVAEFVLKLLEKLKPTPRVTA
jgi:transcriptional regulator with XRE-family HTH domain